MGLWRFGNGRIGWLEEPSLFASSSGFEELGLESDRVDRGRRVACHAAEAPGGGGRARD